MRIKILAVIGCGLCMALPGCAQLQEAKEQVAGWGAPQPASTPAKVQPQTWPRTDTPLMRRARDIVAGLQGGKLNYKVWPGEVQEYDSYVIDIKRPAPEAKKKVIRDLAQAVADAKGGAQISIISAARKDTRKDVVGQVVVVQVPASQANPGPADPSHDRFIVTAR